MSYENEKDDTIDIAKILYIIVNQKKVIFFTVMLSGIIATVYALVAVPQYNSSTKMVYESSNSMSVSSGAGALAALAGISSSTGDVSDYLEDILYSNRFLKPLLKRNWQPDEYDTSSVKVLDLWKLKADTTQVDWERVLIQRGIEMLRKQIIYSVDKSTSIITIRTKAQTPYLAYQLNNYVVDALNRIVLTKLNKKSVQNRKFIESQLSNATKELNEAEHALKIYKDRNAISMSPSAVLKEQRLIREIEVEQKVYLTLRQQYELAKIEEQKDIPVISVIEKAEIPYKKTKPQKKKIVVMGAFGGVFVGVFLVLIINWYKKNSQLVKEIIRA